MSKKKHYCTGTSFQSATGKIDYTFTNDFVFRSIFQRNSRILKSLIASLLHISVDDIFSLVVTNPIELNEAIDDKDFILDITLMFNNSTYINLEMQVANLYNWKERSLQYLCRTFDHLKSGEEYTDALRVIHIGFLNFNLFEDDNEFYSFYKLMNENTHRIYSDKFDLRVVNLTQINNATAEDKLYHIDYWAKMFKATTWEELHMIAQKSSILSEACESLFEINADEISRQKSQAREDYYRMQRMIERKLAEQDTLITKQLSLIAEKDCEISAMSNEIASKNCEISAMSDEIARLKALLEKQNN